MKRGSVSVGMVQALAEGGFAAALAEIIASWPWLELDLRRWLTATPSARKCVRRTWTSA